MLGRIAVVGLGSVLMGDDAAGPYFVRSFDARWRLPDDVKVEDLGTPGPELAHYLLGTEAVVLVDAVRAKGRPGEVRRYDKSEILHDAPITRRSAHDPTLREALMAADVAGDGPDEVVLVGIIPESVELRTGLTEAVHAGMRGVEERVLAELRRLGIPAERRDPPFEPDIWWESSRS